MNLRTKGFTLVEIMITVAIVGIVAAIAIPQYTGYVTRSRLTEVFSQLSTVQPNAEQYWASNRTYAGFTGVPASSTYFTYALSADTDATKYTVTATGRSSMAGFVYTINQSGARATTGVPSGWTASSSCWVDQKSGKCVE
jgi:type IV pilus assembly protein PilE